MYDTCQSGRHQVCNSRPPEYSCLSIEESGEDSIPYDLDVERKDNQADDSENHHRDVSEVETV